MSVRRIAAVALVVLLAASGGRPASERVARPRAALAAAAFPDLRPYAGPGMWVDIFDTRALSDPAGAVATMARNGIRTLYLETGNWRHPHPVIHPRQDGELIEAAHARGMKVVTWYLPEFASVQTDFRRVMRSIRFTTRHGQRADSFGLDIEAPEVEPVTRIRHLLALSARIRSAVGPEYALGAIIPSPRGLIRVPDYWPNFPYAELPTYYDVILPMSYYTFHYDGAGPAHRYISDNIRIIRQRTGRPDIPIHPIGGLTADTSPYEAAAVVKAARERGVTGVSLYEYGDTTPAQWAALRQMPVQPGVTTPSPAPLPFPGGVGNLPGGDRRHPKEAFFSIGGQSAPIRLEFQGFDVGAKEVEIDVNNRVLGWIWRGPRGAWSGLRERVIPAAMLHRSATNLISFVAVGSAPRWSTWGVRSVSVAPA
ncbi:MAG TPA: hypothetical protein VID47_10430 [Actinomycetota bacterium]|jgi:hypothetical protein